LDIYFIAINNKLELPKDCMNLYVFFSKDAFNFPNPYPKKVNSIIRIKRIIKYFLSLIPIPYGILLGGHRKKLDKYYYLITIEKLKRINWAINFQFKKAFLFKAKKYFNDEGFKQFESVLSSKFFIKPIKAYSFPNIFYGAPDNLFKEEFCHLTFIDQKLNFTGFQHGGQYGELNHDRFGEFDHNISDKMFYWGFGNKNIQQNRFNVNFDPFCKIQNSYLIEVLKPNIILKEFFGGSEKIYKEADNKRHSLFDDGTIGMLKHPRSIQKDYSSFSSSVFIEEMSIERQKRCLYIIDLPFQTFMYKAIYQNLPFLMFINREWQRWFTPNYLAFLEFLNKEKVLLYWDQENEFITRYKMIIKTGEYGKKDNKEIINYLERKMK
jgi:hypothetical protein